MSNYMESAFASHEAQAREIVHQDTWGHMAPKKGHEYTGKIVFTHGEYGDITVIRTEFLSLGSSPWFYEDLHNFVGDQDTEEGEVYVFKGMYCNNKFKGNVEKLNLKT